MRHLLPLALLTTACADDKDCPWGSEADADGECVDVSAADTGDTPDGVETRTWTDDPPTSTRTTDTGDPPGTGTRDDRYVVAVQISCPDPDTWRVVAETNMTLSDALLNQWEVLADARGWDEEHRLVQAPEPGFAGDVATWSLTDGGLWTPGTSTFFECGIHDLSRAMVYVVRVFDEGGVYEDCVAWGGDTDNIAAVLETPEGGGDVTHYNGITDPQQVSADNCTVF